MLHSMTIRFIHVYKLETFYSCCGSQVNQGSLDVIGVKSLFWCITLKCGKTLFYSYQNLVKVSTQGQGHIQGHPWSLSTKIYTLLQTTCDDDINWSYESTLIGVSIVNTDSISKVTWDHWGQKCWHLIVNSLLFPSTLQPTFSYKAE